MPSKSEIELTMLGSLFANMFKLHGILLFSLYTIMSVIKGQLKQLLIFYKVVKIITIGPYKTFQSSTVFLNRRNIVC